MRSDPRPGEYKVKPGPFVADDLVSSARFSFRSLLPVPRPLPLWCLPVNLFYPGQPRRAVAHTLHAR